MHSSVKLLYYLDILARQYALIITRFVDGTNNKTMNAIPNTCVCVSSATAVKSIKKQQLVEIRALNNPPKMVKMALESICLLLGEPSKDWRAIRQIIIRDNFIASIINFSTENVR